MSMTTSTNPDFIPTFSSNEIWRDTDTTRCLTDDLDAIEAAIENMGDDFAPANHTHTGYAPANHTHQGYAAEDHEHTGYALSGHGHTGYASSDHTHDGYANASHTHAEYAPSDHNHDGDYLPADGGTVSGELNVDGVLRVKGQQAFYYNDTTKSQTVGTNNATGGTTVCCGDNADMVLRGASQKTGNVLPRSNNAHYCGNANFRWKGIYSTTAVNVSSDERLKDNIEPVDEDSAVRLIDDIGVKTFNYKGDDEKHIGVIAQDIIELCPELEGVLVDRDEDGYYGVKTSDLVFPLIVAVQHLAKKVAELSDKVGELE